MATPFVCGRTDEAAAGGGGVSGGDADNAERIAAIELDERSLAKASADMEHERKVAIFDLLEQNQFTLVGADGGPYNLRLSIVEKRLVFDVASETAGEALGRIMLSMTPFRKIIKDYFLLCESYYDAIRNASPGQIETIDMARRAMHNEGSEILIERLAGKVKMDFDTSRRLFTLICILHMK
ncbi:MAG: UPF0262 family protein [Pseudomonadota bacterium]